MKIAVVGNRVGWSKEFVFNILDREGIQKTDLIVSGGAIGVDTYAQEYAEKIGCQIKIIYPDPDMPSPKRYYDRNEKIALNCDKMIAFDKDGTGTPSGTKNAISHAQKLNKEMVIVEDEDE